MSGDVQPRKRKEKRKRKDELGFEEHRGTSAALGEGDAFIHFQLDHGTGGHWCAKIIFFSLLAILIALIGLIILENRGLSELEANTVESRYSGVLEGWLEDAPEDDHHDEHTLELKHHSISAHNAKKYEDNQNVNDNDQSEENEPEESNNDEEDNLTKDEDEEDLESNENEDKRKHRFNQYSRDEIDDNDENDNDEGEDDENDEDENENYENDNIDDDDKYEADEDDKNFRIKRDIYNEPNEDAIDDDEIENNGQSLEEQNENDDDNDDDDGDDDEIYSFNSKTQDDNSVDDDENEKESKYRSNENDQSIEKKEFDRHVYYSYGEQVIDENNIDDNDDYENDDDDHYSQKLNHDHEGDIEEQNEDDDDHESEDVDKSDLNLERIEREVIDDEPVSAELPNTSKNDEVDDSQQVSKETRNEVDDDDDDDDEFSEEIEDDELPLVEHITAPAGKPFEEVDDESLTEQSPGPDSLADEEEYEKQQEQLRREDAEASHMWLKLFVGGALLVATHALIRRGSGAHEVPTQHTTREETPGTERRMTLIPEESPSVNTENVFEQKFTEKTEELTRNIPSITKLSPTPKHSEDDDQNEIKIQDHQIIKSETSVDEKELYSDEDDEDEQEMPEDEVEAKDVPEGDEELDGVVEEEIADDVEIIEDEQVEEEEEEEISDVDDSDLLHRLEAKYGRLPEPERFGSKPKDGGNSIEDEWPGEPTDAYWREELNKAEEELQQGWLD